MNIETGDGRITMTEKVLQKIVAGALVETEGVALVTDDAAGLTERLRAAGRSGRIGLKPSGNGVDIELRIDVRFGERIQDVCHNLRSNVQTSVEAIAGLPVGAISIVVEGLSGSRTDRRS